MRDVRGRMADRLIKSFVGDLESGWSKRHMCEFYRVPTYQSGPYSITIARPINRSNRLYCPFSDHDERPTVPNAAMIHADRTRS